MDANRGAISRRELNISLLTDLHGTRMFASKDLVLCEGEFALKIAYIGIGDLSSQAANCINSMNMAHAFASNGANVYLVVPRKGRSLSSFQADHYAQYGVEKKFVIKEVADSRFKDGNVRFGLGAAWFAKRVDADVVYARSLTGGLFAAVLGIPVVFESHAPIPKRGSFSSHIFKRLIKCKSFKGIVVITHALKRYYVEEFPNLDKLIRVAADAATERQGNFPASLPLAPGAFNVGYAGNLYEGKGVDLVLKVAAMTDWAHFHIVGGDSEKLSYWRSLAENVTNVTFHGRVDHSRVAHYIGSFDVALLPNQATVRTHGDNDTDIGRWTSPLKAFEYMAASKAIICSDLPVLREIFQDGRNALLCSPIDPTGWVNALNKLRNDVKLRKKLGHAAHLDFLEFYTWDSRAKTVLAFINSKLI